MSRTTATIREVGSEADVLEAARGCSRALNRLLDEWGQLIPVEELSDNANLADLTRKVNELTVKFNMLLEKV